VGNYQNGAELKKKWIGQGSDLEVSEIAIKNQDLLVDPNQRAREIFSHQAQNPVVRGAGT
jgi:hypothetical protein